jgi:hypothetical protein
MRVTVIKNKVDPVSATPPTLDHVPGEELLDPKLVADVAPVSLVVNPVASVVPIPPPVTLIPMFHCVIAPVGPVANWNRTPPEVRFVSVCTPSENVNAVGVTNVSGMFGAKGLANVSIPDTKSLVV